ncbi:hypothetical protein [Paraherbaspirillum soli]|uniref:DUF2892 domain-containing protein n=1 Tax=Paraherbaspirillum soli TaxID=631222 RepID=A0ABW0M914_9BURK
MKVKSQDSAFQPAVAHNKRKMDRSTMIDIGIRLIGTCSFIIGLVAFALSMRPASDYLLAAGVLCHLVSWFGDWWKKK